MSKIADQTSKKIDELAKKYQLSHEAISNLLESLERSQGSMAQFNHPELGGQGQWMKGGMVMIGESSNETLKTKIDQICNELSALISTSSIENKENPEGHFNEWWPKKFGHPDSSGRQNGIRYAYFLKPRRLIVEKNGQTTIYDTLDYEISGVVQQQSGGPSTLRFSSQLGPVPLKDLPIVSGKEFKD